MPDFGGESHVVLCCFALALLVLYPYKLLSRKENRPVPVGISLVSRIFSWFVGLVSRVSVGVFWMFLDTLRNIFTVAVAIALVHMLGKNYGVSD
jgi:hypothetical protein